MIQATRTFRVFVSSTFSDLRAERNALQRYVFPKLRELCLEHGCRFQAIDLRWGVSEEASLDQRTMRICLTEIKRCQEITPRPNFVVLLGDRYGWRPLPYEIPSNEFHAIAESLTQPEDLALLRQWYRLDTNTLLKTVPDIEPVNVYCLQSRGGETIDGAAEKERGHLIARGEQAWSATQDRLGQILRNAANKLGFSDQQRLKYEASATEQEIDAGAMRVDDASEHVFCFFRAIGNLPADESAQDFADLVKHDGRWVLDKDASNRLRALKEDKLGRLLPNNIFRYRADWTGSGVSSDHVEQLCDDMVASLSRVILDQIDKLDEADPLQQEIREHEEFCLEHARHFVGREPVLAEIDSFLKSPNHRTLVVVGDSGSGKTAVLARAFESARETWPQAKMTFRFAGLSPDSSNATALISSLTEQIEAQYGSQVREHGNGGSYAPADYLQRKADFLQRAAMAEENSPLFIFLDGLDQFATADQARAVLLLNQMPPHVKLLVSTSTESLQDGLDVSHPGNQIIELSPLPRSDAKSILHNWLRAEDRMLTNEQRDLILNKFERVGKPLYLKLALEFARHWRSYERFDEASIGNDVDALIRDLFRWLSAGAQHGARLVARTLSYLAASKNGLSEDELIGLLSADKDVLKEFRQHFPRSPAVDSLPVVVWSRLLFNLAPYLRTQSRDGSLLLSYFYRHLSRVAAKEFLQGEEGHERHAALARFFADQALHFDSGENRIVNQRKISELPWHLGRMSAWLQLAKLYGDPDFLKAAWRDSAQVINDWVAIEASTPHRTVDIYRKALETPEDYDLESLEIIASLLEKCGHLDDAINLYEKLSHRSRDNSAEDVMGRVLAKKGEALQHAGKTSEAMAAYEAAGSIFARLGLVPVTAAVRDSQAHLLIRQGDFEGALRLLKKSEEMLADGSFPDLLARNLGAQANLLYSQGFMEDAGKKAFDAAKVFMDMGNNAGVANCMHTVALVYNASGLHAEAIEAVKSVEQICWELGDLTGQAEALHNEATFHIKCGDRSAAVKALNHAEQLFVSMNNRHGAAAVALTRARALMSSDPIRALRSARKSLRIANEEDFSDLVEVAQRVLSDAQKECAKPPNQPSEFTGNDLLASAPVRECEMPGCDGAGSFIQDRIVWIGSRSDQLVGWCERCRRTICMQCAEFETVDKDFFWSIPDSDPVKETCLRQGEYPKSPRCPVCNEYLGRGDEIRTIIVEPQSVETNRVEGTNEHIQVNLQQGQ